MATHPKTVQKIILWLPWHLLAMAACYILTGLLPTAYAAAADILFIDPTANRTNIANASSLLEDPEGKLSLSDVQQPAYAQRFQRQYPNIGFSTSAYWLRYTVQPKTDQTLTLWLNSGNRTLHEITVFAPNQAGQYQAQSASASLPFANRPLHTTYFVFPLTLAAGKPTDIYMRVRSNGFLAVLVDPQLWQPKAYMAYDQNQTLQWLLYMGMAAALGLFNLMLCFAIKDRNYLLYTASLVSIAWSMSSSVGGFGSAYEYFWPKAPMFEQVGWLLSIFSATLFPMLFVFRFTQFSVHLPRTARFLRIGLIVLALCVSIHILGLTKICSYSTAFSQTLSIFATSVSSIMFAWVAANLCLLASRGNRQAGFLCIAWLPMLVCATVWSVYAMTGQVFNIAYTMWASAFELVLMSLALADRFNQEKQARERAQAAGVEILRRSEHELEEKVVWRTLELQQEQTRTKELLHNIFPADIAAELSETGHAKSARYDAVSILFTDFVGFTQTVSTMPVDQMVSELNQIFAAFDDITDACGVEKIKTIGDAYMAVAGLPKPCPDHAQRCVRAALMMVDYLEQRNQTSPSQWTLRLGIHSGPVVAGVVGKRKFAFDLWGDTVNLAARMENASENGRVNISAHTYALIRQDFQCHHRGKLEAKGQGQVDMYFVTKPG